MPLKQKKQKEKTKAQAQQPAPVLPGNCAAEASEPVQEKRKGTTDRKSGCPIPLESGCEIGTQIDPEEPGDAVLMHCTNSQCTVGSFVHLKCYETLENLLIKVLATTSWARSWTDAQRRANLWDKKGYSLISKMCKCLCGKGLARKDTDYKAPNLQVAEEGEVGGGGGGGGNVGGAKPKKKKGKQLPILNQADYKPGFINRQLPNVPTGAAFANRNKSDCGRVANLANDPGVYDPLDWRVLKERSDWVPAELFSPDKEYTPITAFKAASCLNKEAEGNCESEMGKAEFWGDVVQNIEFEEDCLEQQALAAYDSLSSSSSSGYSTDMKGKFCPATPTENRIQLSGLCDCDQGDSQPVSDSSQKHPTTQISGQIEGVETFFRSVRCLLDQCLATELNPMRLDDVRLKELLDTAPNMIKVQVNACQGLRETMRLYHKKHGIEYMECAGEAFIFLRKGLYSVPPPLIKEEIKFLSCQRVVGIGTIQNVFPKYGYIKSEGLDTNIFFVPSHVQGRPVGFYDGGCYQPNLHTTCKTGEFVEFEAVPQKERSGCRWLATRVSLMGGEIGRSRLGSVQRPLAPKLNGWVWRSEGSGIGMVKNPDDGAVFGNNRETYEGKCSCENCGNCSSEGSSGSAGKKGESSCDGRSHASSGTEKRLLGSLLASSDSGTGNSMFSRESHLSVSCNGRIGGLEGGFDQRNIEDSSVSAGLIFGGAQYDIFGSQGVELGEWLLQAPPPTRLTAARGEEVGYDGQKSDVPSPAVNRRPASLIPIGSHLTTKRQGKETFS